MAKNPNNPKTPKERTIKTTSLARGALMSHHQALVAHANALTAHALALSAHAAALSNVAAPASCSTVVIGCIQEQSGGEDISDNPQLSSIHVDGGLLARCINQCLGVDK
jgi:hypothetical protein